MVQDLTPHSEEATLVRADRDRLTHLLRGLAGRLEELDRVLADLAWRGRDEGLRGLSALEAERDRLTEILCAKAEQLRALDDRLSDTGCAGPQPAAGVGSCPYCGYPSVGSGLCAFCRPHSAVGISDVWG